MNKSQPFYLFQLFTGFLTNVNIFPINFLLIQLFKRSKSNDSIVSNEAVLPWWVAYVGWLMAVLTITLSTLFIIFYAIQMGDSETRTWLSSTFFSLLASIFVIQPFEVSKLQVSCCTILQLTLGHSVCFYNISDIPTN